MELSDPDELSFSSASVEFPRKELLIFESWQWCYFASAMKKKYKNRLQDFAVDLGNDAKELYRLVSGNEMP